MLKRHNILQLAEASLETGRPDFARSVTRSWLKAWPGDFAVNLLLARALNEETESQEALEILKSLGVIDPENSDVQQNISKVARRIGNTELHGESDSIFRVLIGGTLPRTPWIVASRESISALERRQWESARVAAERAVTANSDQPLPALLLLKSHWLAGDTDLAYPLAEGFFERWPKCVALCLCLAESVLRDGDYTRGVALLHDVVGLDPSGDEAERNWGTEHAYRPIWPPEPEVEQTEPLPSEVAARLGINLLENAQESPVVMGRSVIQNAAVNASEQVGQIDQSIPTSKQGACGCSVPAAPGPLLCTAEGWPQHLIRLLSTRLVWLNTRA